MEKRSQDFVPKTYEELFNHYIAGMGSLCHQILRTMLPYEDEDVREDLAHDVFTRCMDKGMIERFDPEKANFGGVTYFVTRTIVCNYLRRKAHAPTGALKAGSLTEVQTDREEFEPGSYSLDKIFTVQPEAENLLDVQAKAGRIMKAAANEPKNNRRGRSLGPLVKLLFEGNDVKECSAILGVTTTTIKNWTQYLTTIA